MNSAAAAAAGSKERPGGPADETTGGSETRVSIGDTAQSEWLRWGEAFADEELSLMPDWSLARSTTLRIGGPCDLFARVSSTPALRALLQRARESDTPWFLLGQGANVLVPDAGLPGLVIRLQGDFKQIRIAESAAGAKRERVRAGAAVVVPQLARKTVLQGLLGLEALGGFPASVGGAVTMNAGCYGTEISELLEHVELLLPDGSIRVVAPEDLEPSYRSTNIRQQGAVVLEATFRLQPGDVERGLKRLDELNTRRWDSLPSGKPNAGSTFKNPTGEYAGRLLEQAGFKGRRRGDAAFSEKHANVVVNLGSARAKDVVLLMREARLAVADRFGVQLEPELLLLRDLWSLYAS